MLFNSFQFILFFSLVTTGYFIIPNLKLRNLFLLFASYYFYMQWEPAFGLVLLAITILTYFTGGKISILRSKNKSCKTILALALILSFLPLVFFKYYNFLNEIVNTLLSTVGCHSIIPQLGILAPIGISFFTFQAVGYLIDIYRSKINYESDFITYALFVSFFPVILSGPIQRAYHLIPQLKKKKILTYENLVIGFKLVLWGLFMKLCIADRLGDYVNVVYDNLYKHSGTSILCATIFYSFQIYCDFSGYSLVAIGCSRILGFKLPNNFRRPYFATSIKDFWKRWHIALSSWFMEYLYFSLGGNRVPYYRYLLNLMIVFLICGLWHGAAWTFIVWGFIHGLFQIFIALKIKCFGKSNNHSYLYSIMTMTVTFMMITISWTFFRANTINDALIAFSKMLFEHGRLFISPMVMLYGLISLFILFIKDISDEFIPKVKLLNSENKFISILTTAVLLIYIILFGVIDNSQFIYFQF